MKTAHSRIGVLTVVAGLGLLGCENWRSQAIRHNQDSATKSSSNITDGDASIPKGTRAGLSNGTGSRLTDLDPSGSVITGERSGLSNGTGTWSRESREIESHFSR